MKSVVAAAESWSRNRLDIFGLGTDKGMYHQAWDHGWWPSVSGWAALGGRFDSPPAVTA
jgi:hypothetical protein